MGQAILKLRPEELQAEGPWIRIEISAPLIEIMEGRAVGLEYPKLVVNALIDTGASLTVVNPELIKTCKLRETGYVMVSPVGREPVRCGEHAAAISFPGTNLQQFAESRVVSSPLPKQAISCLVGRDILRRWRVVYNGTTGEVVVTD